MESPKIDDLYARHQQETKETSVMKKFPGKSPRSKSLSVIFASLAVVLAGVATGWFLSGSTLGKTSEVAKEEVKLSEKEFGIEEGALSDKTTEAEGMLVEGGIKGEGTHHLERPGGQSQNVYLTSTVIDLQSFVGKKVKVWGDTLSGVYAGWLMDVVKIKELE